MLRMFSTVDGQVRQISKPENGSWLALADPTDVELATVSQETGIDLADLRAPLDDEERSRVDVEDDYTMIIVDIPTVEERSGRDWYTIVDHRDEDDDHHRVHAGHPGAPSVHGRHDPGIQHFHAIQIHSADPLSKRDDVPAVPAHHRPGDR